MAEPASDHRDVNTSRNQMHRRRMTEAMRCYMLRGQARRDLRRRFDVLRQFEADTRCAERDTIPIDEVTRVLTPLREAWMIAVPKAHAEAHQK